ncbi:MAG: Gfo/Idh/MocA family oxidoreductase [Acetobacterium sp.]|nr:Gfo/Idh/MocA family oxidoreductase [Acetobacterium sp.]
MKSDHKIRIAILGTGFGLNHARIFSTFDDVEVVGIFGRNEEKTSQAARELRIKGYTEVDALINDAKVDVIDVCLPTQLHAEYCIKALDQGKDVFCETPVAFEMTDAIHMKEKAGATGRKLLIARYVRFQSEYKYIRDMVSEGRIGEIKFAYADRRTAPVWGSGWDEHFITNLMLHDIDYLVWLLGMPMAVTSRGLENPTGGWNQVSMALEYSRATVSVDGCGIMPASFPFSTGLRVVGEKGAIDLNWHWGGHTPVSEVKYYPAKGEVQVLSIPDQDPYEAECRYFVDCLSGKADPVMLDIKNACESLNVAVMGKLSLEQGGARIRL